MQSYTGTDDKNFSGHLPNGIEANDSDELSVRYTNSEGNNKYHNNIPPVFAIYIWKRTVQSVGELPKIEGEIWNIAWQSADNPISKSGVFSDSTHREAVGYATSFQTNRSDGFGLKFGADKYHNNMPPTISAYAWKRTAQSVGELPERVEVFVKNSTGKSISGYAINTAGNGTIANDAWGSCNLVDALNYNLQTTSPNHYHNNLSSSIATYCWKRTEQSVGELPSHYHQQYVTANPGKGSYSTRKDYASDEDNMDIYPQVNTGNTGNDLHHNNLPPAIATYGWKRIS